MESYGMNCEHYNSLVYQICQNGESEVDNYEKYNVNCSVTKFLVVTGLSSGSGYNYVRKTELIDLTRPDNNCDLPDYPKELYGAISFKSAQGPVVCGGFNYPNAFKECFILTSSHEWESWANMTTIRRFASVVPGDDKWNLIIGGFTRWASATNSVEAFSQSGSEGQVVELLFSISRHCVIKINDNTALIIGGYQNGQDNSAKTWFFDLDTFGVSQGPRLQVCWWR